LAGFPGIQQPDFGDRARPQRNPFAVHQRAGNLRRVIGGVFTRRNRIVRQARTAGDHAAE
jgi:hypothetical protein